MVQTLASAPNVPVGPGRAGIPVWRSKCGCGPVALREGNKGGRGSSPGGGQTARLTPTPRGLHAGAAATIPGAKSSAAVGSHVGKIVSWRGSSAWLPRPQAPCGARDHPCSPVGSCEPKTDAGLPHAPPQPPLSGCDQVIPGRTTDLATNVPQRTTDAWNMPMRTSRCGNAHQAARPK